MMEDCGAEYRENGSTKDVYQIFADNGTNLVRVRLWHNPDWQ
jgi:arabinogalactan endo-1,4-beta-galactosidase